MITTGHRILVVGCDGRKSRHYVTELDLATIFKHLLKCYTNHEVICINPFPQMSVGFFLQADKKCWKLAKLV